MQTTKQIELIDTLLSQPSGDEKMLCEPTINYLLELGYTPKKHKKNSFVVEFEKSGRNNSKDGNRRESETSDILAEVFCM